MIILQALSFSNAKSITAAVASANTTLPGLGAQATLKPRWIYLTVDVGSVYFKLGLDATVAVTAGDGVLITVGTHLLVLAYPNSHIAVVDGPGTASGILGIATVENQ